MSISKTVAPQTISLLSDHKPVLIPQRYHSKTLDIGRDGSTASTNQFGHILQLNCYHPLHGVILACPFAQFDGERFYDPAYVREYRKTLLDYVHHSKRGFGILFSGISSSVKFEIGNNDSIFITYSVGPILVVKTISICEDGTVLQSAVLTSTSKKSLKLNYSLALNISVHRASYGQLTEGGPIPLPLPQNEFKLMDESRTWAVFNPNLDASIQGTLYCDNLPVCLSPVEVENSPLEQPVRAVFNGAVRILPGGTCTMVSSYKLQPGPVISKSILLQRTIASSQEEPWKIKNDAAKLIIKGNLSYIVGNCRVPVDENTTCFITDHVALPLGWNRDNYWQIRYLLDVHQNVDKLASHNIAQNIRVKIATSVRQHLNWVFRVAQRPHGYWHRSYLTTGVPKDGPVFQQDQQCYPILELCDFLDRFPSEIEFVKSILAEETIPSVLAALYSRQDKSTGLYATEETPGDDAVEYPFHFSSHILLWHTFSRLAQLLSSLNFNSNTLRSNDLEQKAVQIRASTLKHFVAVNPVTNTSMFAYLTDGAEVHTFYHDANDLPTLFLPSWNFASPSSPEYDTWIRTMTFGLSPDNVDGFYPDGPYGGLGSVHTRGPWPLGFAQEFIFANMIGDRSAINDSWRRIQGCMFWDGLFSEAVDPYTGACTSKAWFSWPGSIIGSALLKFQVPLSSS